MCSHSNLQQAEKHPRQNAEYWANWHTQIRWLGWQERKHMKKKCTENIWWCHRRNHPRRVQAQFSSLWVSPTSSIALFMLEATPSPSLLSKQLWTGLRDPWSRAAPFDLSEGLQTKMLSPIGREKKNKTNTKTMTLVLHLSTLIAAHSSSRTYYWNGKL